MTARYKAKPNTAFKDKDAAVIGRWLDEQFPDGDYTPEEIVELARSKSSPVHRYFEWDDSRAAFLYRLQQARRMIQCVVEIIDGVTAPRSVSVRVDDEGDSRLVYRDTRRACAEPEVWAQVLDDALSSLAAWRRRYEVFKQIKELRPVISAVKKLELKAAQKKKKKK